MSPSCDRTAVAADPIVWHARWPGRYGNVVLVARPVRRGNSAYDHAEFGVVQVRGIRRGAVVEVTAPGADPPAAGTDVTSGVLRVVDLDLTSTDAGGQPKQLFVDETGTATAIAAGSVVKEVVVQVRVLAGEDRVDVYDDLATHPAQRRWIGKILEKDDPADEDAMVYLQSAEPDDPERAIALLVALQTLPQGERLSGGDDGQLALPDRPAWATLPTRTDASVKATGLEALGEIDDIAIVALPDGGTYDDPTNCEQAADRLIAHAEKLRYRIAVVDAPGASSMNRDPRVPRASSTPRTRRSTTPGSRSSTPTTGPRRGRRSVACCCRHPGSSPASTPATTSRGASSRRRPTRSCAV